MSADYTVLQDILVDILGSNQVYYQPPVNLKISYPAIIYQLDDLYNRRADNKIYNDLKRYQVTYIAQLPTGVIIDKINQLDYCSFDRYYQSDQLNHYVFIIYI